MRTTKRIKVHGKRRAHIDEELLMQALLLMAETVPKSEHLG